MKYSTWKEKPFTEALIDNTAKGNKLKQSAFKAIGKIPIVDQGQEYIAGFSDEEKLVWKNPLPVVIFGDHTRAIKYIDFPFILGADGVKVLVPCEELNAKFAYYYLKYIEIPSYGYSRHFRYLKEFVKIPIPPLSEQERIVRLLDEVEALRNLRSQADTRMEEFVPALFYEMFGDPNNSKWSFEKLGNLLEMPPQNGLYVPKENYCDEGDTTGIEMVHMSDLFYGIVPRGNLRRVKLNDKDIRRYSVNSKDLLIARRSINYEGAAKACLIPEDDMPLVIESSMIRITPNQQKLLPIFLFNYINNPITRESKVLKHVTKSTISGINQSGLISIDVYVPPLELQYEFAERVKEAREVQSAQVRSEEKVEALYQSMLDRAFKGEL